MEINYGTHAVSLGPLSATIYSRGSWRDGYPAHQIFADELELLLQFAQQHRVLDMYSNELAAKPGQRDAAIDELRVAHLLSQQGFPVIKWRPVGLAPKEGEFLVHAPGANIFVEVKRRGWEGDLPDEERSVGRHKQPKYRQTEAFWGDSSGAVTAAIEKAYPKFAPQNQNLLVITDDLMVPLGVESDLWAHQALYSDDSKFTNNSCSLLGGVGFLVKEQSRERAWCEMRLYTNPQAQMPLPASFVTAFGGRDLATA